LPKEFESKHAEPIFLTYCCLLDKLLAKELRNRKMQQAEMCDLVRDDMLQKSFLIYACVVHLYSKNINDLSIQELLGALDLPAFELWSTFSSFMMLDPNLPQQLREHLNNIERQLTLHLIWQKDTIVVKKLKVIIARN